MTKVAKSSNRGSKPGERRGGRSKGVPNKVGADLREYAQQYTQDAVEALVSVVRGQDGAAKVAAAREILDRGHGKASQLIDAKLDVTLQQVIHRVIDARPGN